MAILCSGPAPQDCPFHEEMDWVLQIKRWIGCTSSANLREQTRPWVLDHHNQLTQRRKKKSLAERWARRVLSSAAAAAEAPEPEVEDGDRASV